MSTLHRQSWTLKQIREGLQFADRRDEALPRQRCEILLDTIRRLQKPRPHFAHRAADDAGRKAQVIADKFIRVCWASISKGASTASGKSLRF